MPFIKALSSEILDQRNNSMNYELRTHYSQAPGFSLIEVVVSIFLVSALSIILVGSTNSLHTRKRTELTAIDNKAALKEIERVRNLEYSSITTALSLPCDTEFNNQLPGCRIDRQVTNNFNNDLNLKQVLITLYFNYRGVPKFVVLETFK